MVADTARVARTAYVGPQAQVYGDARVTDYARIVREARVYGSARVFDRAAVGGSAQVYGCARIGGDAYITEGDWDGTQDPPYRRPRSGDRHRGRRVTFYVAPAQLAEWRTTAEACGVSLSAFLADAADRMVALCVHPHPRA